jgi:hypothetical protein
MFRSLNPFSHGPLLAALEAAGFERVFSRQISIVDEDLKPYADKQDVVRDRKLLRTTPYEIVPHEEIIPSDMRRIEELYRQLYLDKYSYHNPRYSEKLIRLWHERHQLHFTGLRGGDGVLEISRGCSI